MIGDISIPLMGNDVANGSVFGTRKANQNTTVLIAYVTDALRWQNESVPDDDTLRGTANYAIWLYGKYGLQAKSGTGGGGSVIPIPPSVISAPDRLDFYVTASTPIATGESSKTFASFIGFKLMFDRNNQPQSTANDGVSTYFSWDKDTGVFQCFGSANEGELFSLIPYV